MRGCSWDKIELKMRPTTVTIINMLKEKLGLDNERRDPGTSISADIVTIPRLASCFPIMVCFKEGGKVSLHNPKRQKGYSVNRQI